MAEAVERKCVSEEQRVAFKEKQKALVQRNTLIQEKIAELLQEVQGYQTQQDTEGLLWMDWQTQMWREGANKGKEVMVLDFLTEFAQL